MKFSLDFRQDRTNAILTSLIIIIVTLIVITSIKIILSSNNSAPRLILDTNRVSINVGDMYEIKYKTKNINKVDVTYSSSNTAIAVVSNNGTITGVKKGETTIKMTYSLGINSSYSNLIFVTVN